MKPNSTSPAGTPNSDSTYDVVVIGGGAAGLSGALTLSRARLRVALIDAGEPRNSPAGQVHNYLGREGTTPGQLYADGRGQVRGYGGTVLAGRVGEVIRGLDGTFGIRLTDGRLLHARKILAATGVRDELPALPGLAERWGRDVLHCPFCHGWEVQDLPIGILATDLGAALHQAQLWRQWSSDVVLFPHTAIEPNASQSAGLAARGIQVVHGEVAGVEGSQGSPVVRLTSGELIPRCAVVVLSRLHAQAGYLAGLGLVPTEQVVNGLTIGTALAAGPNGATEVPGVYAAGNLTLPMIQVLPAAASGQAAAAAIIGELLGEDVAAAMLHFTAEAGHTNSA